MVHTGLLAGLRVVGLALVMQAAGMAGVMAQGSVERTVAPDPIEGVWQTVLLSEITIAACPEGFCGTLSKIIVPSEGLTPEELAAAQAMDPATFTDLRNQDPELRNRPMLGLQILTLLPSTKPNIYDGEIYNPQDGNTYSGYVEMTGPDAARGSTAACCSTWCARARTGCGCRRRLSRRNRRRARGRGGWASGRVG